MFKKMLDSEERNKFKSIYTGTLKDHLLITGFICCTVISLIIMMSPMILILYLVKTGVLKGVQFCLVVVASIIVEILLMSLSSTLGKYYRSNRD